jgi:hypothetical protein
MANPLEKDSVDGSARAWMGNVGVVLILILTLVVVMREVTAMVGVAILIVATSCSGWWGRW